MEDKMQIKSEEDRKEKIDQQAKEKADKKHLQIDPLTNSEYANREKLGINFHHWKGNFMSAVRHYWHGTKLLWTDTKISSKLLLKLINGKELSRREQRQLTHTTSDILKLIPFSVFIVVPFMEFLIPILLKVFPNMIPSTFKGEMQNKEKLKRKLKARMEYTKFLQETSKEMEKEIGRTQSSEIKKTAEDLDEFMSKVRTGDSVSDHEILCFAKLFDDELVLDNLNRPRLLSMCNIMGIQHIMSDDEMRVLLASTLTQLKDDDILIWQKGIKSLSDYELELACRCRGYLGLSKKQMCLKLRDWLDLSLNHAVPISLLILSRPFAVSDKVSCVEALRGAISSLPDSVVRTLGTVLPSDSERKRKLEFLEMQEALIKEEERERALAAQKAEEHVRNKME
ncbi:LETM1 and EF-hand domain-containing protein 1 [Carex littledalei]|uniref:LETM1 and EF-hand domain-containing protein 1 n=1 Tax=Carex littledalei TaxID=544730 RepID=A0A833R4A6_9POAL|nr:LETM1 and EF-hand domain-containing protein 1 [Carex littledalei]